MKQELTILLVLVCAMGCGQKKAHIPESLRGVNDAIAYIDSSLTIINSWESGDSISFYLKEMDINDIIDDSRESWAEFKSLCSADKYKEAMDYYDGGGSYSKPKKGNILAYLIYSTITHYSIRETFYYEILRPLLSEYRDTSYANREYIDCLRLDYSISQVQGDDKFLEYLQEVIRYVVDED